MNDVPHNDDSSDDIDDLYRRTAAQDPTARGLIHIMGTKLFHPCSRFGS